MASEVVCLLLRPSKYSTPTLFCVFLRLVCQCLRVWALRRARRPAQIVALFMDQRQVRDAALLGICRSRESHNLVPLGRTTTLRPWPSASVYSLSAGLALRILVSLSSSMGDVPGNLRRARVPGLSGDPAVYPKKPDSFGRLRTAPSANVRSKPDSKSALSGQRTSADDKEPTRTEKWCPETESKASLCS